MKNAIKYFYNLEPQKIINKNNYYFFILNNEEYYLKIFDRNINEEKYLIELNENLIKKNILINEIIINKDKGLISLINDIPYYLFKVYINPKIIINLSEISYFSNIKVAYNRKLVRNDWSILWSERIDYLEKQINEMGIKYPILVDSFNYYAGMAENAISYLKETTSTLKPDIFDSITLSHRKIKTTESIVEFYNIVNITIDHKSRDIAEYIKNSFFNKNTNIFNELNEYFNHNYYSEYGIRLLISRILYPSFYFDLYDEIVNKQKEEKEVLLITKNIDEYEIYLKKIFLYFKNFYNIPSIDWIIKKDHLK